MGKHVERTGDDATTFQYALSLEEQGVVAAEKKGLFEWIKSALAGEVQTTVVWEADEENPLHAPFSPPGEIEPVPPGRQQVFYESADSGSLLPKRKQTGDKRLFPKEKKKPPPKAKRQGGTPFQEIGAFQAAEAARADGHGIHTFETVNGGIRTDVVERKGTQRSPVGEEGLLFRHTYAPSETAQGPRYSDLSPKAKALLRKQRAEEGRARIAQRLQDDQARVEQKPANSSSDTPSSLRVSPDSIYPGKHEQGVRWETLRRMIEEARKALK